MWSTEVFITFTSGNAADTINIAMAPLAQAAVAYSSAEPLASAPNSVTRCATFGGSGDSCTMKALWGLPPLNGLPGKLYPAFASALGTASTLPGLPMFVQVAWRTDDNNALSATAGIRVQVRYHVEFLNRCDAVLLNT